MALTDAPPVYAHITATPVTTSSEGTIELFSFENGDFAGGKVRVVPGMPKRISVIDVVAVGLAQTKDTARSTLSTLKKRHPEVEGICLDFVFPGRGARATPVTDAKGLVTILLLLPGPKAAKFRLATAELLVRYMGGDESLVEEVKCNRATVNVDEFDENVRVVTENPIVLDGHTIRTVMTRGLKVAVLVDYAMLVRGLDRRSAAVYVSRLVKKLEQEDVINVITCNVSGYKTPCVSASDMALLTFKMMKGARTATAIAKKWALDIARLEGGDLELINQIEENARLADENPDGPNAFMRDSVAGEMRGIKRNSAEAMEPYRVNTRPCVMSEGMLVRYERQVKADEMHLQLTDPVLKEAFAKVLVAREEGQSKALVLEKETAKIEAEIRLLQLQRDMRAEEDYLPPEYAKAAKLLRNTTARVCNKQMPGIYVFVSKYGVVPFLKIGLSLRNVSNRVKEAATWHTDAQKRLLFALPVPHDKLRDAEKFVHQELFQENIEREMFGVEFSKLAKALLDMAERYMGESEAQALVLDVFQPIE